MTRIKSTSRKMSAFRAAALTTTALVGFGLPSAAMAQEWTGTTSNNWLTGANWNPAAVPTATDDVTIDHTAGHSPRLHGVGSDGVAHNIVIGSTGITSASLTVFDGATLTSNSTVLGQNAGNSGSINIGGSGANNASFWTNTGSLIIGQSGFGSLAIEKGTVTSGSAVLGANAGALGQAFLSGVDSHWVNNGSLTVGGAGDGVLRILSGGSVSSNSGVIGEAQGSTGSATVDGAGSTWTNNGTLTIGHSGVGTFSVLNGGSATNVSAASLGGQTGAKGTAIVDGANSTWTSVSDLFIGLNGTGDLTISKGGKVANGGGHLGYYQDSFGTVTVDGVGSSWTNTADLNVGYAGSGALTISNGAAVSNAFGVVGHGTQSTGTVTVTGAGSTWTNNGTLTIGHFGAGTFSVLNGGSATNVSAANLGGQTGAKGTAIVDGANSTWTSVSDLFIGLNGTGDLTISKGGKVANGGGHLGYYQDSFGTVTVDGVGSSWTNTTDLNVGYAGSGALTISNGAAVSNAFGVVGHGTQSTGTVTVTGAGSTWTNTADLIIGNHGTGTLDILNGGTVYNSEGILGFEASGTGSVTVDGGTSAWINRDSLFVGVNGAGALNVINGGQVITGLAGASVGILGAEVNSHGVATIDGPGSYWSTNGVLYVGGAGDGSLTVANGGLVAASGEVVIANLASSTGELNIGAGAAAGTLISPTLRFGAGDGTLNFNHTNPYYAFGAAISGLGTINHQAGLTHLLGDSSLFTGATHVTGGALFVDNQLGGDVDVQSGASLGGAGMIGGAVVVAAGGTLQGLQGQTLTMDGLHLNGGAVIDATFDTAGGSALFNVINDLTLNGTLNLTAGGAFGPGVYALITYGGALTDNGLDIGVVPLGSTAADYAIQTSVAGEVNLVNNALPTFSFWDGDASGNANNNAVNGGSGVWSATSTNFTNIAGSANGSMYPQPGFAIFQGPSGSVVVDNAAGQVAVTGMQFASDGYSLSGGSIELADAGSVFRVGNGSAAGASFVAGIDSVLTGTGGLYKTDLGTLVLSGDNTYTGGTTVSSGTLQIGDGGAQGSIVGDVTVAVAGTLAFSRSDVLTFTGQIQGGGQLEQNGSGTTNLTHAANAIGNVAVNNGTLGVTAGGGLTTGTLHAGLNASETGGLIVDGAGSTLAAQSLLIGGAGVGAMTVVNGGTVSSNLAAVGVMAGSDSSVTVNGAGSVWVNGSNLIIGSAGSGAVTLANGGAVSVGGQLVLAASAGSAGTLNIGAAAGSPAAASGVLGAATLQFGAGAGTLNFNHTNTNYVFGTSLSGAGTVNQLAGNTSLTGASNGFAGAVNVNGGRLAVNGSLAGGQVTVNTGGTLGGNGAIGSLTANAGSIVAPGNSIGTLNVIGNAGFGAGSTYHVELGSNGASDHINVGGSATIAAGAQLSLVKADAGPYVLGRHYEILNAAGGLTGMFTAPTVQLTNFIGLVAGSDADSVFVDVAKTKTFASAGASDNETAVGGALDGMPQDGVLVTAVANLMDDASAQDAFNALSGELYASTTSVMIEDSRFVREAAMDRMRYAADRDPTGAPSVWGHAFGAWGEIDSDGNAASVEHDVSGLLMGFDGMVGDAWRIGAIGGYSRANVDGMASSAEAETWHVGVFGGRQFGDFTLRSGVAYSGSDVSMGRAITFAGLSDGASADYKAETTQAFAEVGYAMTRGGVALEPFAGLAYVDVSTDAFAETGGAAALTGQSDSTAVTFATLGARAASTITLDNGWSLVAHGSLGYRHAFGDTAPRTSIMLAGSSAFDISGAPIASDVAVIDLGVDAPVMENGTLTLSYGGQFGSGSTDHALRANLVVKF